MQKVGTNLQGTGARKTLHTKGSVLLEKNAVLAQQHLGGLLRQCLKTQLAKIFVVEAVVVGDGHLGLPHHWQHPWLGFVRSVSCGKHTKTKLDVESLDITQITSMTLSYT